MARVVIEASRTNAKLCIGVGQRSIGDATPAISARQVVVVAYAAIAAANGYWRSQGVLASMLARLTNAFRSRPATGRRKERGLAPWREQLAKELMRKHIEHGIRSVELAHACGLSTGTFAARFRRSTGTTPHQWLMSHRVKHAIGLMDSSLPISDIALRSGFADQAHFTRVFSARVGVTPGAWRNRASAVLD
jgi:AraC-like DNA-binding protein